MKKENYRVVLSIFFVSAVLALTGCPHSKEGKVTGGGWIEGTNGGKASFGFNANGCPAEEGETKIGKGHFTYHNKVDGVKMHGWITKAYECYFAEDQPLNDDFCYKKEEAADGFLFPYYALQLDYRSTDPKDAKDADGPGTAVVIVSDCGEGVMKDGDHVRIVCETGTYKDYTFDGYLIRGNIQSHTCDDE